MRKIIAVAHLSLDGATQGPARDDGPDIVL